MSHNIYQDKFTTATKLRNEILKKQDKKIKALIFSYRMLMSIAENINCIRARTKSKEMQNRLKEKSDALAIVFNNSNEIEIVLRELLGTKELTAMTDNFTTAEENKIAEKITEIFEVLKNV